MHHRKCIARYNRYRAKVLGYARKYGDQRAIFYDTIYRNKAVQQNAGAPPDWEPSQEFFLEAFGNVVAAHCWCGVPGHLPADHPSDGTPQQAHAGMQPPASDPPLTARTWPQRAHQTPSPPTTLRPRTGAPGGNQTCRRFNQNGSCVFGSNCRFSHKCEKCGSAGHGSTACPRG